ncbi:hypothetical protein HN385_03915 [archaeon]|jgi:hypothetical protein|nr:hypothetical protein [archaeon]MBT3450895.1 hypothetical protein [archaeon]MBT6869077.1 hypothetical protein [archaeon]MBT7193320.1 hypothetical protein [archaeon]MBT7380328.1 hypothetical protein [archaeon]
MKNKTIKKIRNFRTKHLTISNFICSYEYYCTSLYSSTIKETDSVIQGNAYLTMSS